MKKYCECEKKRLQLACAYIVESQSQKIYEIISKMTNIFDGTHHKESGIYGTTFFGLHHHPIGNLIDGTIGNLIERN